MVYFAVRSENEAPIGHKVISFEDESLLDWYQRNWVTREQVKELTNDDGFEPDDYEDWEVRELLSGGILSDLVDNLFPIAIGRYETATFLAHMYGHPVPENYADLEPFIDSFEDRYCEGGIKFTEGAVEIDTNDDEADYTWHLFDTEFADSNPKRVGFLLMDVKELPESFGSKGLNMRSRAKSLSGVQNTGAMTHVCLLSALDGQTINDIDGCFRIPVRLPDFKNWFASQKVDSGWHSCLIFIRAFALLSQNKNIEDVLRSFGEFDQNLYWWAPRILDDYNFNNKEDQLLLGDFESEIQSELIQISDRSKKIDPNVSKYEYQKFPVWVQSSEHMIQVIFEAGRINPDDEKSYTSCQRWIFFDDLWAAEHPNLAESILRYGCAGGAAQILTNE